VLRVSALRLETRAQTGAPLSDCRINNTLVKFTMTSRWERRYTVKVVHMVNNSGSTSRSIISCLGPEIFVQINGILTKFCLWKLGVPVTMTHRVVTICLLHCVSPRHETLRSQSCGSCRLRFVLKPEEKGNCLKQSKSGSLHVTLQSTVRELFSPVYTIQPIDNRLNEQWLFVQHGCQTGCQTGLTTGWMFVYTIQPVVKPVWQPFVSCKRGISKQRRSTECRKTSEAINFCNFLYNFTMTSIFLIFGLHNFSSWTAQIESWTAQNWLDCRHRIRLGGAERSCWEVDVVDDKPHFGHSQQRHWLRTKHAVILKPYAFRNRFWQTNKPSSEVLFEIVQY